MELELYYASVFNPERYEEKDFILDFSMNDHKLILEYKNRYTKALTIHKPELQKIIDRYKNKNAELPVIHLLKAAEGLLKLVIWDDKNAFVKLDVANTSKPDVFLVWRVVIRNFTISPS